MTRFDDETFERPDDFNDDDEPIDDGPLQGLTPSERRILEAKHSRRR